MTCCRRNTTVGPNYVMTNGELKCNIFANSELSTLTINCVDSECNCESISILQGGLISAVLARNYFANYFVEISNKTLPWVVKKLFFGHFGITVWQPYQFDSAYHFSQGFITEEEGRNCKIGISENIVHIFSAIDSKTQTITIKDGQVVFDDGEIEGDFSCHAFQDYFAELAKELPDEVKKLFNGCYGVV